jgi:Hedgehog amino-terminal signalling domain
MTYCFWIMKRILNGISGDEIAINFKISKSADMIKCIMFRGSFYRFVIGEFSTKCRSVSFCLTESSKLPMLRSFFAIVLSIVLFGCKSRSERLPELTQDFRVGQSYPDVDEDKVCGAIHGRIHRGDTAFTQLVQNSNSVVEIKDEERTGADRFMTPRLCDCLDCLASKVIREWPSVRVRVTDAWDEDGEHREESLHYEGRAVDLTTSDRDRHKYGRLARLAAESGFDFVWYEDAQHVHASVRREGWHQ